MDPSVQPVGHPSTSRQQQHLLANQPTKKCPLYQDPLNSPTSPLESFIYVHLIKSLSHLLEIVGKNWQRVRCELEAFLPALDVNL